MKKENRRSLCIGIWMLLAFSWWTVLVQVVDVQPIGPQGSSVGLATVNRFVHRLTGVHLSLYTVTDWLELVPVAVAAGFALFGLVQWVKRKSFLKVDASILALGGCYIVLAATYVLFEAFVVNYRPVLINGCLEASYPSSTTMLVTCVMPTAILQLRARIKREALKRCLTSAISVFILLTVTGRLLSGVHWLTDIVGGMLCSGALVMLYHGFSSSRK